MKKPLTTFTIMPVLFLGHGSPMNAIEDNEFSRGWQKASLSLPRPDAILCISAHWETEGTKVTAMEKPKTIHDFGGFPRELYEVQYPARGSKWLAQEVKETVKKTVVEFDGEWGLDHGCWSVLSRMYPAADVPVVQLSIDANKSPKEHFDLAKDLSPLRDKGVLIVGSGNIVHNLGLIEFKGDSPDDFNKPFGFDWAIEASNLIKRLIKEEKFGKLVDYQSLGRDVRLAVPTNEHYLPMLYALGLKREAESVEFFNDKPVAGSLTMTSMIITT